MPVSLATAITDFQSSVRTTPLTTWFIHENPKEVVGTIARDGQPSLSSHILTLRKFAKVVVAETRPEKKILDTDVQFIKFAEIASRSPFKKGDIPLPLDLIKDIISVYTFTGYYNVTIEPKTDKHRIIGNIIREYTEWCRENSYLDSVTVLKEAENILNNHEFKADYFYIAPGKRQNPLMQELYTSLQSYPHEDYFTEDLSVKPEITCLAYHTAKSEITATLDRIAGILESGVKPQDILILSPSISSTEEAIREFVPDFYATIDGIPRPIQFSCSDSGSKLSTFPIIESLLSVLSAVTSDYGVRDLEYILSSKYFPNRPAADLTPGKLHLISQLAGSDSGKSFLLRLEHRIAQDNGYRRFEKEIRELKNIINWLEPLENAGETYDEIASSILTWLGKSGWKNADADDMNAKARKEMLKILNKFRDTAISENSCSVSGFIALVQRLATQNSVKMYAKSKDTIRIVSMRDASYDGADYVFMVNMTAESIPNVIPTLPPFTESETDELIPPLKKDMYQAEEMHMNTAMLAARKELIVSYAERKRKKAYSPSGFLTRLGTPEVINSPVITHSISRNQIDAGTALREGESVSANSVGLTDGEEVYRRAHSIQDAAPSYFDFTVSPEYFELRKDKITSPTSIETYLSCPLKWLFSKHLGLYTPFDQTNESTKMGTAIHGALEKFFKTFTVQITEDNREEARSILFRLAEDEIDAMKIPTPSWEADKRRYLGRDGMQSPLDLFLNLEIQLESEGWRTTEDMVEFHFDKTLEHDGKKIALNGYIDRILVNEKNQKQYIILDYKTGGSFKYDPTLKVQIPLYAEAYRELKNMEPADGIYLKIDPKGARKLLPIPVTGSKDKVPMDAVIDDALNRCTEAIDGMQHGRCNPVEQCTDRYCNFKSICKRYYESGEVKE